MSVRGERVIYRDRSRETERDPDSRRSYTTVKRYQVPDRSWEEDKVDYDKIIVRHEHREDPPPPPPSQDIKTEDGIPLPSLPHLSNLISLSISTKTRLEHRSSMHE